MRATPKIDCYLELGSKRVFAVALDWPGWTRSGSDETLALQALLDYAPRFAAVVRPARLGFQVPGDLSRFKVVQRLKGDTTTDFGAPGCIPRRDADPVDDVELHRLQAILKACWHAFDQAVASARGTTLRSGPRGGGRDLQKMVSHVHEADKAYISRLGWKSDLQTRNDKEPWRVGLDALAAASHGELPARGPRGGLHWPARYFARRSAWHILDHAWEIEDRLG